MTSSAGTILIVEDEENLGATLKDYLTDLGHTCYWANNGVMARDLFKTVTPKIVLMDIGLPDTDGITLSKELKALSKNFVLLFLSAQNDPDIKVEGLEIGAADYITKPFALKELTLRLERILQNQSDLDELPDEIVHGNLKIWFKRYEVEDAKGKLTSLSQKECHILELLYKNKGEAISRNQIIDEVWGENSFPSNRTVDNYIVTLRKWSETDKEKSIEIQSIRGVGYKLTVK